MSIPNLIYKIKSKTGIDKMTLVYLFIIIGVGIGSFGLGRISLVDMPQNDNNTDIIVTERTADDKLSEDVDNVLGVQGQSKEKRYVASKNGKMYYSLGCSGAKRINEENKVWFNTKEDAEKSGYTMSSACK